MGEVRLATSGVALTLRDLRRTHRAPWEFDRLCPLQHIELSGSSLRRGARRHHAVGQVV